MILLVTSDRLVFYNEDLQLLKFTNVTEINSDFKSIVMCYKSDFQADHQPFLLAFLLKSGLTLSEHFSDFY